MNFVWLALDIHSVSRYKGSGFGENKCAFFGLESGFIVYRVRKRGKSYRFIHILYQNRPNGQHFRPKYLAIKEKVLTLGRETRNAMKISKQYHKK
ncbi:MAG: hypothetical protein ACI4C3_10875 [Bacteroides sp.]